MYFYDPQERRFGEMKSWKLHDERAIDVPNSDENASSKVRFSYYYTFSAD